LNGFERILFIMTKDSLCRLSGSALFFGALLSAVGYLLKPEVGHTINFYFNPLYLPSSLLTFIGAVFMLLGMPGMYAYQAGQAGKLGVAGFTVSFVGLMVLEVGTGLLYAFVPPLLASNPVTQFLVSQPKGGGFEGQMGIAFLIFFLIGLVGSNLGGLLYGIATYRARVFPRGASILIFGGVVVGFLLSIVNNPMIGDRPIILMLAGFAWCGIFLRTGLWEKGQARALNAMPE
jgi:hypothetical protein